MGSRKFVSILVTLNILIISLTIHFVYESLRDLETLKLKLNNMRNCEQYTDFEPTLIYEKKRRRIWTTLQGLWDFIEFELKQLMEAEPNLKKNLTDILDLIYGHKISILSDWKIMSLHDGHESWRQNQFKEASNLIQKRFQHLMNPKDCKKAKFLKCINFWSCGWGCQHIYYSLSFAVAYGLKRTLIYSKGRQFFYEKDEYTKYYEPITQTCQNYNIQNEEKNLWSGKRRNKIMNCPRDLRKMKPRLPYIFNAVPTDIVKLLEKIIDDPFPWWSGQIQKFLFNLKPKYQKKIDQIAETLGFKHPIVGVHVRRTDKIKEANHHHLRNYMKHVKEFYDILELSEKVEERLVFLATDDPVVIKEEILEFSVEYKFIFNETVIKEAKDGDKRHKSSWGILTDVNLLARCDHFVGTFSSSAGRRIVELMYQTHLNTVERIFSVDIELHEKNQKPHRYKVLIDHIPENSEETMFKKGEILKSNIYYKGHGFTKIRKAGQIWNIPSFKLEKLPQSVKFPTYANIE